MGREWTWTSERRRGAGKFVCPDFFSLFCSRNILQQTGGRRKEPAVFCYARIKRFVKFETTFFSLILV